MRVVVGVDAGGTSTVAAVSLDGQLQRKFSGPAANASSSGLPQAGGVLVQTVADALGGSPPDAIYVGAAGAGRVEISQQLEKMLRERFPSAAICVRDDAHIALRAGVEQGDGCVLIAGTGSIAYAEVGSDRFRNGGYGYLIGDDGSGFSLGAAAIKHVMRAHDGRAQIDDFVRNIEDALQAHDPASILQRVYGDARAVTLVASLAPVVLASANEGARFAARIVQQAALDLYELIKSLIKRAGLGADAPIVFAGGLLRQNSTLTFLLESRLHADLPNMPIHKNASDPALCAMYLAERLEHARS
jgi:N-acetylglucosamine kinase-like BadF-type ATPase